MIFSWLAYASTTVQPVGIPLTPVGQFDMLAAFVKVPVEETPLTQLEVPLIPKSVAKHVILLMFVHPLNMSR